MTNVTPRPCANEDCDRPVTGREKLCDECCSWCECGRRRPTARSKCRRCSQRAAAEGGIPVMVKNRRGIYVARR